MKKMDESEKKKNSQRIKKKIKKSSAVSFCS